MDATPQPPVVFLSFSVLNDQTSVPSVFFSSCLFIPRTHFETSFVMISYFAYEYDVISSRCLSYVWNACSSTCLKIKKIKKIKLVDEIKEGTYLYVSLHVKHKNTNSLHLYLILVLGKIQDASRANIHKVLYTPILSRRSKTFQWRYKIFLKYCNVSKTRRGLRHRPSPPPSLVLRWGCDCVSKTRRGLHHPPPPPPPTTTLPAHPSLVLR